MAPSARRMLWLALLVQGAFLGAEVVGGIAFNSLALLGDAAHMVADVGALGLALLAASLAARPPSSRRTWGWPRAEFAAAACNSFTLVVSCCWIAVEAVRRAMHPETVHAHGLLVVAVLGLGANVLGAWLLARADRENVNVRAAMAHLMLDAASSVGVIVAGVVIALGGPVAIDTVASLLIAGLAVRGTWPVLRSSLDSLLDAAPASLDGELVARTLLAAPGVRRVHDLHVWEPGPRRIAATAHVLVRPGIDVGSAIERLQRLLRERHGIDHATLQVAHDRTAVVHWLEPRLPRDVAVRHAASLLLAGDPLLDAAIVLPAVEACAAHAPSEARLSPVRLAVAGRRLLQTRQGRPA